METSLPNSDWSEGVHFEPLANLAHELRTPVQVLLGYLDILRDDRADVRDTAASPDRAIIERMNANVHELAQTVENVLEYVLASAGAEAAVEEEIELGEFFSELEEILLASNRNPRLTVRTDLDGAPEIIVAPRRPLRSIVLNLAINAIKFTAEGAVSIRVAGDIKTLGPSKLRFAILERGSARTFSRQHSSRWSSFRAQVSVVTAGWGSAWR